MGFYNHEPLEKGFDAAEAVNVRLLDAGNTAEQLLKNYTNSYERFWMTPRTHGSRALTASNFNEMFALAPEIMTEINSDGTKFVEFVQQTYPEQVGTDLFPERYLTIPYNTDENGMMVTLKPEWEVQEQEEV